MNQLNRILAILIIILSFALAYYLYDQNRQMEVPVAAVDIEPLARIQQAMVTTRPLPRQAMTAHLLSRPEQVVDQFATQPILAGEPFDARKLVRDKPAQRSFGSGRVLAPGQVAFAVPLDLAGFVGGALRPGDYVNVIIVPRLKDRPERGVMIMQQVRVLDVRTEQGQAALIGAKPGAALLEVTSDQATALAVAVATGKVYLALTTAGASALDLPLVIDLSDLEVSVPWGSTQ